MSSTPNLDIDPQEVDTVGTTEPIEVPDPTLARYDLEEEVGRGGMGRVVRARDRDLLRRVALKLIRFQDPVDRLRFTTEAQITGQLDHPGVLPVYEYGVDDQGNPYFTMKLISEHVTLRDLIHGLREGDPSFADWTLRRRVQAMQKVCQALHYAHQRGVLHRDLKPDNVVIGRYGEVYLVDWGVAELLEDEPAQEPVVVTEEDAQVIHESEEGFVVGTPRYMAPEYMEGGPASAGTDVFSLCAMLYELLTLQSYLGEDEFPDLEAVRLAVLNKRHVPAERFSHQPHGRVPRWLSRICAKGLERDPTKRYDSADEVEAALQLWLEGKAPVVCPGTCMQRSLFSVSDLIDQHPIVVPAVVIVLGLGVLAWIVYASWVALTV